MACIYENARTIRLPINIAQELHRQIKSLNNGKGELDSEMADKVRFDNLDESKVKTIETPNHTNILKSAIENSDAIIKGSDDLSEEITEFIEKSDTVVLDFQKDEDITEAYLEFYSEKVLENLND